MRVVVEVVVKGVVVLEVRVVVVVIVKGVVVLEVRVVMVVIGLVVVKDVVRVAMSVESGSGKWVYSPNKSGCESRSEGGNVSSDSSSESGSKDVVRVVMSVVIVVVKVGVMIAKRHLPFYRMELLVFLFRGTGFFLPLEGRGHIFTRSCCDSGCQILES